MKSRAKRMEEVRMRSKVYIANAKQECSICGNSLYIELYDRKSEIVKTMLKKHICFQCAWWSRFMDNLPPNMHIVNGKCYIFRKLNENELISICSRSTPQFFVSIQGNKFTSSNNVQLMGTVPERFLKYFPDTDKSITYRAHKLMSKGPKFKCRKKGCYDRYDCHFYAGDEGEPWNEIPKDHEIGEECCSMFLIKDSVFQQFTQEKDPESIAEAIQARKGRKPERHLTQAMGLKAKPKQSTK